MSEEDLERLKDITAHMVILSSMDEKIKAILERMDRAHITLHGADGISGVVGGMSGFKTEVAQKIAELQVNQATMRERVGNLTKLHAGVQVIVAGAVAYLGLKFKG